MVVAIFFRGREVTSDFAGNAQKAVLNRKHFARIFVERVLQPWIKAGEILPVKKFDNFLFGTLARV
jgi:hypothetical protein